MPEWVHWCFQKLGKLGGQRCWVCWSLPSSLWCTDARVVPWEHTSWHLRRDFSILTRTFQITRNANPSVFLNCDVRQHWQMRCRLPLNQVKVKNSFLEGRLLRTVAYEVILRASVYWAFTMRQALWNLLSFIHFTFKMTLWGRNFFIPIWQMRKMEAQGGTVTCLRLHSQWGAELAGQARLSGSRAAFLIIQLNCC